MLQFAVPFVHLKLLSYRFVIRWCVLSNFNCFSFQSWTNSLNTRLIGYYIISWKYFNKKFIFGVNRVAEIYISVPVLHVLHVIHFHSCSVPCGRTISLLCYRCRLVFCFIVSVLKLSNITVRLVIWIVFVYVNSDAKHLRNITLRYSWKDTTLQVTAL